jgi:hypothetical protein
MIVFDLACENSHRFEGWFASSEDFEHQTGRRLVSCPSCGTSSIARLPHASHIRTAGKERASRGEPGSPGEQQYAKVGADLLSKVIEQVLSHTEDVGTAFPEEARKIHYRESPERRIRGTASRDEVAELREEGIEVVALPVPAHRLGKAH